MQIMGIVNVTPDSFSDGGQFANSKQAVDHALKLIDDGADILDIGGESTRPGAEAITEADELERVLPVIQGIRAVNAAIPISIDTYKTAVARAALDAGATIVNDVSAGRLDAAMFDVIREYHVPSILMHMQGLPRTMQDNPVYHDVVAEVKQFLQERVDALGETGAPVYVDPGIGFGKTTEHNLALLRNLSQLHEVGPIVLGISRKRFLSAFGGKMVAADRDPETLMMLALCMNQQCEVYRVHDVRGMATLRSMAQTLYT